MSLWSLDIRERSFADRFITPEIVPGAPVYSFDVRGGPDKLTLPISGEDLALWEMIELLRSPVDLTYAPLASAVWWGYIESVEISTKSGIKFGVGLREMFNRYAVAYTYVVPGESGSGTRLTTDFAQNDFLVNNYGKKEKIESAWNEDQAGAETFRSSLLGRNQYPRPLWDFLDQPGPGEGRLICKGWWHTLEWQYASREAGLESHESYDATQDLGAASGNTKIEQGFQLSGSETWKAATIAVRISKQGTPVDTVYAKLYDDSGGHPGTLLATGQKDGADIGSTADWVIFDLDSHVGLALSTTYHIELSRSGGVDGSNYYRVSVDEALGYAGGALQLWNGSAWVARSTDADLAFKVGGVEQTTDQISNLVDNYGQFIERISVIDASGKNTNQFRDGDLTTLDEVVSLMDRGTSNDRRLLASITSGRELRIYEEPAYTQGEQYYLDAQGDLSDESQTRVLPELCKVGVWADLIEIIPGTVDTSLIANPSPAFIERAEYNANTGKTRYTPRGQPDPRDALRLQT